MQQSFLAYFDILGIKNLFSSDKDEDVQKASETMEKILSLVNSHFDENQKTVVTDVNSKQQKTIQIEYSYFSDSFVASAPSSDPIVLGFFITSLCRLQYEILFETGFLCRGAISDGLLLHKDKKIYGKALCKAVQNENKLKLPFIEIPSFSNHTFHQKRSNAWAVSVNGINIAPYLYHGLFLAKEEESYASLKKIKRIIEDILRAATK